MNASEMTNDELAKNIEYTADCLPEYGGFECADELCEAAARLRRMVTIRTDNSAVIVELERRLKIAEDALEASLSYNNAEELEKAERKAKKALAIIREKGVKN